MKKKKKKHYHLLTGSVCVSHGWQWVKLLLQTVEIMLIWGNSRLKKAQSGKLKDINRLSVWNPRGRANACVRCLARGGGAVWNTHAGRNNVQQVLCRMWISSRSGAGGYGRKRKNRQFIAFCHSWKTGGRLPGAECCLKMLRPQLSARWTRGDFRPEASANQLQCSRFWPLCHYVFQEDSTSPIKNSFMLCSTCVCVCKWPGRRCALPSVRWKRRSSFQDGDSNEPGSTPAIKDASFQLLCQKPARIKHPNGS